MTENPNIQPDPNTPRPAEPTPAPTPKTPAEIAAEAAAVTDEPGPGAGAETGPATGPGSEPSAASEPVTQNPATGSVTESPWGGPAPAAEEDADAAVPVDPNAPNIGVAATFLPGIDAAAVLALVVAALGAGVYLLVNPLVQAHDAARTWSDFKNNVPRTKQDPFGVQRDWVSYQSWGHIILGLVAVLLALLVLALWTAQKNKLRSRSFAQAALVLGLAVVLYGILLKTGAVGSEIPSLKDISTGLSTQQSQ